MQQKPQQYTAVILKKRQLAQSVYHFFIHVENPSEFLFTPGQYVTFIIDEQTRRQYSVCSSPQDRTTFEFVIDTTPMGPGSKFFLSKKEGDRVAFLGPLGTFTLSQNSLKKVLVATGTGIAPFRSMIVTMTNRTNMTNTTDIALYWGLRHEDEIYWDQEFRAIVGHLAGFQYFLTLSKPSQNWNGLTGHVTEHVLQNEKNGQNSEFYLCGNNAMIEEMKSRLSAINVKNERIRIDLFF